MTRRLGGYRRLIRAVLAGAKIDKRRRGSGLPLVSALPGWTSGEGHARTLWLHAASVGEWESLVPVLESALFAKDRVVLSFFSRSAEKAIQRYLAGLSSERRERTRAGYCPLEGEWGEAIARFAPRAFITSKYEAWPELWAVLSQRETALWILAARDRRAYRLARSVGRALGVGLPKLRFVCVTERDASVLRRVFPGTLAIVAGDPRWDRVSARVRSPSARARALIDFGARLPRPWWVLGSIWESDWKVLKEACARFSGTVWAFPHRTGDEALRARFESESGESALKLRSSDAGHWAVSSGRPARVWIDEQGFLAEFYSAADLAFVGGGFGQGLHSTIEPALQGIPVAGGGARAEKFPEIAELSQSGQFQQLTSASEVEDWLRRNTGNAGQTRERWLLEARARLGAAERIARAIDAELRSSSGG